MGYMGTCTQISDMGFARVKKNAHVPVFPCRQIIGAMRMNNLQFRNTESLSHGVGIEVFYWNRHDWRITLQVWNRLISVAMIDIPY